ncbi:hypothetical protein LE181_28070 [Streptomyces sp. SCA3-4]|uniref:hypothetical protein n=1 Tax=Streptomyces sichuanensis TaxID=2871810 RepID=UPI001CE31055|nr:hypothetical protein [Streptomyces sichuanensis]MCA6096006.1 hypothetical protein [Streptomyces sichuanensis]
MKTTMTDHGSARGSKALVVLGLATAAAIIGAVPAIADDHSTSTALQSPPVAGKIFDDHSTGVLAHLNGGADDHSTTVDKTLRLT